MYSHSPGFLAECPGGTTVSVYVHKEAPHVNQNSPHLYFCIVMQKYKYSLVIVMVSLQEEKKSVWQPCLLGP